MTTIAYSFLDSQMTPDDSLFSKILGRRVTSLRKESGLTQTQLAETLEISQQLIAAYEAGARKIPAAMVPRLATVFAVSLEELMGVDKAPARRGPVSFYSVKLKRSGLLLIQYKQEDETVI